jgi:hypothetical protein
VLWKRLLAGSELVTVAGVLAPTSCNGEGKPPVSVS